MTRIICAATAALLLGGCSTVIPGYAEFKTVASGALDQAVIDRQNYNDRKADVVTTMTCDISVGAYARMAAGDIKRGVGLICGLGDSQPQQILMPTGDGRFVTAVMAAPVGAPVDLLPGPAP